MSIEQQIIDRIQHLITQGQRLRIGNQHNQILSEEHRQNCSAWLASALHIIQLSISEPDSAYRKRAETVLAHPGGYGINKQVGELTALLSNLLQDINSGLLTSIANSARAETFDNFLDHAKSYLVHNQKNEAGVIAGVVFEDSLRRICRNNGINEKGVKVDTLISDLVKSGILLQTKAKRSRAAADVRTNATHAQWDNFDLNDVQSCIDFTNQLISDHLNP